MGQAGKVWREADSDVMILSKIVGIVYLFPNHHRESWFTRRSQSSLFIVTVLLNFHPCYFDEEASNFFILFYFIIYKIDKEYYEYKTTQNPRSMDLSHCSKKG